jgi:hypothetical protein
MTPEPKTPCRCYYCTGIPDAQEVSDAVNTRCVMCGVKILDNSPHNDPFNCEMAACFGCDLKLWDELPRPGA